MARRKILYFTPTQVANLMAWYKADALALSDGTGVATWVDSSGSTNDATQATGGAQPIFKVNIVSGKPVLRFAGGQRLIAANPSNFDLATHTIFIVAASTTGGSLLGKNTTGFTDGRRRKFNFSLAVTSMGYASGADGQSIGLSPITATAFNIWSIVCRADNDHDIIQNGTVTNFNTALSDSAFNSPVSLEIGDSFGNGAEGYSGDIAEIMFYSRPLTTDETLGIQNYLSAKYAITGANIGANLRTPVSGRVAATGRQNSP